MTQKNLHFSFGYAPDGEPCLKIQRLDAPGICPFAIRQADAWRFSRDHQQMVSVEHDSGLVTFINAVDARMTDLTLQLMEHLFPGDAIPDGQLRARFCAKVMSAVEDRLPDLVNMPPQPERKKTVVGEASISIDGGPTLYSDIAV